MNDLRFRRAGLHSLFRSMQMAGDSILFLQPGLGTECTHGLMQRHFIAEQPETRIFQERSGISCWTPDSSGPQLCQVQKL